MLFYGILFTYTHSVYLLISAGCCFFITLRYSQVLFFIAGMSWACIHQWFILPQGMPKTAVVETATVQGTVVSIPNFGDDKSQFNFLIDHFNEQKANVLTQLAWYNHPPSLHQGERWQFEVKLKKPRNFNNPGSYDYVQALQTRHIF